MKSIGCRLLNIRKMRIGLYIGGLILGCMAQLPPAQAQAQSATVTGKWAVSEQKLDNGEDRKILLDLNQQGNDITGKYITLGYSMDVIGKVDGNHFQLFAKDRPTRPLVHGDLNGQTLTLFLRNNHQLVAKPATAADEIPIVAYIEPPALHAVPSNGLAKTPPMGWNSWNKFQGKIDDATVRQIADEMVSSGMRDAGYVYLNIDDTWEGQRDAEGVLHSNHKFPDMKALADYVHSKGLKLGIYSSPGPRTCAGYPGSYGHEEQDAKTWASWGIDYLKYDWCSAGTIYKNAQLQPVYQKMGDALASSGRPIVYSLCEYGLGDVQTWGPSVGANLWRTTGDISDHWDSMSKIGFNQDALAPYAAPGHWNDPDMLEVGNGGMTDDEYRTHMSLWSLLAAPLLAGNDLRSMSQATKDILLNRDVIAIDQDSLGKQATRIAKDGDLQTWEKPLAGGGVAVGVFNLGSSEASVTVKASDLKLANSAHARDVWGKKEVSFKKGVYTATIPSHGVLLLQTGAAK
jgi:alpha-galactosidase